MSEGANPVVILEAAVQSAQGVLAGAQFDGNVTEDAPFVNSEMCVLVGVTGDVRGSLVIESSMSVFSSIGEAMFGMPLEGPMLESFAGEVGNMVAGNMATFASGAGVTLDITPPTVVVGDAKLGVTRKSFSAFGQMANGGDVRIHLLLEQLSTAASAV